jgi:hypothetical protein
MASAATSESADLPPLDRADFERAVYANGGGYHQPAYGGGPYGAPAREPAAGAAPHIGFYYHLGAWSHAAPPSDPAAPLSLSLAPPQAPNALAPPASPGRSPRRRSRSPRINDIALESPEVRAKIFELIDHAICSRVCNLVDAPLPVDAFLGPAGAPSIERGTSVPVFTFRFPLFPKRLFAVCDELFVAFVHDLAEAARIDLEAARQLTISVNVSHGAVFADVNGEFAKGMGYFSHLSDSAFPRVLALAGPHGATEWPRETQLEVRPGSPAAARGRHGSPVFVNYSAPKAGVLPLAITPEGRVFMLLQRPAHATGRAFRLCKGGVDLAETPHEAAARELWEESGGMLCVPPATLAEAKQMTICRQHSGVWAAGCQLFLLPLSAPSEEWLKATAEAHSSCNGVDSAEVRWFALERPATDRRPPSAGPPKQN